MSDCVDVDADVVADIADENQLSINVQNLSGEILASIGPPMPKTVSELKFTIEEQCGIPRISQKLLQGGDVLGDLGILETTVASVTLVKVDESRMYSWDLDGNPDKSMLEVEGAHVRYTNASNPFKDYCNVQTQDPIIEGVHFFEFVMHHIGDEQWCGVTADRTLVGCDVSGHSAALHGCFIYNHGSLIMNPGSMERISTSVHSGDVIGVVVDAVNRTLSFSVNGVFEKSCAAPEGPLYLLTHVDTARDHGELRKKLLSEAPEP